MSFKNEFSLLISLLYYRLSILFKKINNPFYNITFFFILIFLVEIFGLGVYVFTLTNFLKTPVQLVNNKLTFFNLRDIPFKVQTGKISRVYKEKNSNYIALNFLLIKFGNRSQQFNVNYMMATSFIQFYFLSYLTNQLDNNKLFILPTLKNNKSISIKNILLNNYLVSRRKSIVSQDNNMFNIIAQSIKLERRLEIRSCIIHSSLLAAMNSAHIPNSILPQIVDMFNSSINFAIDLHRGDRFHIIYETFWNNDKQVRVGRLLAGEFINGNNIYQAIWFHEPGSKINGDYYSVDGKLLRKTFFRFPLPFRSISSGFAMRKHPIRGIWKKHNGVDFAAPSGTPICASSDGIINFIGKKNGYGNIVVLKHANNYTTFYGHMSRFAPGMNQGTKVYQNDIIGYVGKTGLATKPHLHYELRINNIPKNPLLINNLQQSLTGKQLQRFRTVVADMTYRLTLLRQSKNILSLTNDNH